MIGNDPRYQAIIDAYTAGQLQTTAPQYNPIYDIRREQIEAGELPSGSQFPRPQLDTTPAPVEEGTGGGTGGGTFDPCPPGYQLIDGVCQPDSMFGNDRDQEYTGPKIENGIIEGYQELEPMQQKMGTFYQTLSPAMKAEYEKASSYGRGIQFKRDPQGNIVRIVAKSPTVGQLIGDIGGGIGNVFGNIGNAAMDYIGSGGLLGSLISAFTPKQTTVTYRGTSDIIGPSVMSEADANRLKEGTVVGGKMSEEEAARLNSMLDEFINDTKSKTERQTISKMVKQGTGASGPPGRNYTVRSTPKKGTGASGPPGRSYSTRKAPTGIRRPGY